MKNYIMFEDGEIIFTKHFNKVFPMTMVKTNTLRVYICQFIVNKYFKLKINSLEWKILINLLSLRSNKIDIITALVLIAPTRKIKEINTDFINQECQELFDYDINIIDNNFKSNYIDHSQFLNAIIKFLINNFFRLFKQNKDKKNSIVIRAWTELDIELHKEIFYTSTIFIYPFGINLKRSMKFIKKCFKENSNVTLMGVPYSLGKLIKIFFNKKASRDLLLLEYEVDAMYNHKKDFANFNTIYTSDDYIPTIPILYDGLLSEKKVINIAHGMGMCNPYNIYTQFKVINGLQKQFYEKFETNIKYSVYRDELFNKKELDKKLETTIIFIHQNFSTYNLFYEEKLQQKIFTTLNDLNICNVGIKLHPNCNKEEKNEIFLKYKNLKEIINFDLNNHNYIFIATCSSAYYDFRQFGQFIFIEDDLFKPTNFFTNITTVTLGNLKNLISTLLQNNKGSKNSVK